MSDREVVRRSLTIVVFAAFPRPAFLPQQNRNPPVAETRMFLGQRVQPRHLGLLPLPAAHSPRPPSRLSARSTKFLNEIYHTELPLPAVERHMGNILIQIVIAPRPLSSSRCIEYPDFVLGCVSFANYGLTSLMSPRPPKRHTNINFNYSVERFF